MVSFFALIVTLDKRLLCGALESPFMATQAMGKNLLSKNTVQVLQMAKIVKKVSMVLS